ncbi:glycosyltransferase family 4 protein [Halalkalibaculum sp. DA384]|uniref:glycosyltransferase family 4 protein n=1 Tax=Halalkalibaculum sp. DA384 TaxID=3373606 RepID=UPI003754D26A
MNVLISALHTDSKISGVGNYSVNLINKLVEQQPDDKFYVLVNKHIKGALNKHPNLQPIEVHHPNTLIGTIRKHLFHFFSLEHYGKKYNADVIHVLNPILLRSGEIPIIVTVHDLAELYIKKYNYFRQIYRIFSTYRSCKSSAKIISISENTKKDLVNKFKIYKQKVEVIYQSYGVEPIRNGVPEEPLNEHGKYFLFVGKGLPHKNLGTVLKAFYQYKKEHNDEIQLVIVGEGNEAIVNDFQYSRALGKDVVVKGYVSNEELRQLYKGAFCFLMPSIYEGFGLPLIEAMAYGLPIISSNAACLSEITQGQVLYHDPEDIQELKESMIRIIDSEEIRRKMINKYPEILNSYTWENTARRTFELYKELL